MPEPSTPTPEREPFRVSDEDLGDLASTLAKTIDEVRQHGVILDRLAAEPDPAAGGGEPAPATTEEAPDGQATQVGRPSSPFIVAMGGEKYATELAGLADWVHFVLLPFYGREISTARPWCKKWYEHPEAVARLHALWLAWQQLTATEAGQIGTSTWHRDHLDHALLQLRAPDGPFAACTTSAARPTHRLLSTPAPVIAGGAR